LWSFFWAFGSSLHDVGSMEDGAHAGWMPISSISSEKGGGTASTHIVSLRPFFFGARAVVW
jgi:hypothetical protein